MVSPNPLVEGSLGVPGHLFNLHIAVMCLLSPGHAVMPTLASKILEGHWVSDL